jgi:hypothetical protein
MTNDERAVLGGVRLPYADQATGIGPFNLKQALQSVTSLEGWNDLGDETEDSVDVKTTKLSIKPWSIETCFGYWVPSALDRDWRTKLQEVGSVKRERLEWFREELGDVDKKVLVEKYREYLSEVRSLLTKKIPRLESLLAQLERDPFEEAFLERFVSRVISYLEDKNRLKRLAEPFVSAGMPEIWEDVQAYKDFRTSFFDHLERTSRLLNNKPRAARIILERLGIDSPLGSEEEWSELFGGFLKTSGWTDRSWAEPAL